MALRKPLVVINGVTSQLPAGDTLNAPLQGTDSISMTNGEAGAITQGMPAYISAAGTVKKAKADAAGTRDCIGLVLDASIAAAATGVIATYGPVQVADWTAVTGTAALTAGAVYYLSAATAGQLTTVAPSATGQYVVQVGKAIDTTTLLIDPRLICAL